MLRSLGFALEGLTHALRVERNLQLFSAGFIVILIVALSLHLARWEWIALLVSGGAFFAVELFNTALERLTDAVDALPKERANASLHASMKATKDVSAAAALVGFVTMVAVILLVVGTKILS
jgi:undecaprenol kinase